MKIAVYCKDEKEVESATEIAKHYKTDFTRVNVSTTAGKHNDKTHIDKKTYAQFLEFCIREIEWMKCDYVHILQHALRLCGIEKTIEL